jgi:ubiquinone/menaquinone biosynthesis C-methylase UbiE
LPPISAKRSVKSLAEIDKDTRFWDKTARKYAAGAISDMVGYERTLERTRHSLRVTDRVYEFGCGTGTTALKLAPSLGEIIATDISPEMIAIAREKASAEGCTNARFEVGTPDAPEFPDASFDVVMGFNALHLIAARAAALREVHRLLKPGGLFISKTPCLSEMNSLIRLAVPVARFFGKAPNVWFFTGAELEAEIVAAGFEIVERDRHGSKRSDPRQFLMARRA